LISFRLRYRLVWPHKPQTKIKMVEEKPSGDNKFGNVGTYIADDKDEKQAPLAKI